MSTQEPQVPAPPTPSYHRNAYLAPLLNLAADGAPGFGTRTGVTSRVKWMGGDEEHGPWIYWVERSAGEVIRPHKHRAGRVEFVVRGAIEWFEGSDALTWLRAGTPEGGGRRYEAGSLTWVPAGKVYGYRILEDTDVLLWFDGHPRGTDFVE